ncbi:MAG: ATP-binding cassette domain-containing protein [Rubrivivax sp.]|nr:ATP-binding cassette domain-containing protein [Rubrivivax sp.]
MLHDLTLGYDRHPAVHHLDLRIAAGSLVAVVGPNGAGKSTLLKGLAGLLTPIGGRIERRVAGRLAFLPQQVEIDREFPATVLDTVSMGLWHEVGAFGGFDAGRRARCRAAIDAVGLAGFERRTLDTLSGGQFQRVLFARLLLRDASLLLLDEPFSAVDEPTTEALLALLERWQGEGRTVIAVLHDLALVRRHFPQTLLLAREAVAFGPTAAVLTPAHLQRARGMSEAFDDAAAPCDAEAPGARPHAHHAHG